MKKLMIAALAVVAFASVTEASNFIWKTKASKYVYQAGGGDKLSGADCYIFAADGTGAVSMQSLLDAFAADSANFTLEGKGSLDTKSTTSTSGAIASKSAFDYGTGGSTYNFYFATLATDAKGNKMIYFSDVQSGTAQSGSSSTTLSFIPNDTSKAPATTYEAGTLAASGWYTAVPEPTSGLLLLLGVAGLALRRRRA